jgi:hypothetical protein
MHLIIIYILSLTPRKSNYVVELIPCCGGGGGVGVGRGGDVLVETVS